MSPQFTKGMQYNYALYRLQMAGWCVTGGVDTEEDNVIPPTRYASPGESLKLSCDKKRLPMDHVSEENMVAFSALPRWAVGGRA